MCQWILFLLLRFCLSSNTDKTFTGLHFISNSTVSCKKQDLLTLCEHLCSPLVFWRRYVLLVVLVFCAMYFILFVFVQCRVPNVPESLYCPLLITPSILSDVYGIAFMNKILKYFLVPLHFKTRFIRYKSR